jgi:DNA polymerase-3 subunit epsilon
MTHRPLVLLDIETTGASARYARITEIGALRVENHQVVATYSQLVNPEEPIPPFITQMTGISNEMVWDAPTFRGIADELELFLSDAIFVAHNVNFDYSFIKAEYARIGNKFNMDRMCSVQLSRKLYPEHRSHALDRVIERLGIEVKNRHRALDDAEVIWKFIQQEYARLDLELFKTMNSLVTYSR